MGQITQEALSPGGAAEQRPAQARFRVRVTGAAPSRGRKGGSSLALHCMLQALSCAHCLLSPRMDTLGGGHHVSRARAWRSGRCQRQERDADLTASQPQSRTAPGPHRKSEAAPSTAFLVSEKDHQSAAQATAGWELIAEQRSGQGTAGVQSCLEKYCLPNARAKTPAHQTHTPQTPIH